MTGFRPNKPAWKATQAEVNRVAIISQQELAASAGFTTADPRVTLGDDLKVWLDIDASTHDVNGISAIPDVMGGASAVQSTNAQKPAFATTGNGLGVATSVTATAMTLALSAGLNDTTYFGMSLWIRPTNTAASTIFMTVLSAGGATANRMELRQNTNDIKWYVYQPGATRSIGSVTSRGFFFQNQWRFVSFEYNGAGATEAEKAIMKDMGTNFANPMTPTFQDEAGTSTMPATLVSATGNMLLFNRTTAFTGGFQGQIGPDIFFYDPRNMTDAKRIALANYRVPTL
jgi:hypothetical protein